MRPQFTVHIQPHAFARERSLVYRILTLLIASLFILVVFISALFIIAKDALPTDSFYSIKRGGETVLVKLFSFHPTLTLNIEFILLEQRISELEKVFARSKDISLVNTIIDESKKMNSQILLLQNRQDRLHYYEGLKSMLLRQYNLLDTFRQTFFNETIVGNSNAIEKIATIDFLKNKILELQRDIDINSRL